MSAPHDGHDEFDAQLADRGDDRPGMDDLEENDYSALVEDDVEDDYPEDALEEDIDLVVALYREDSKAAAIEMAKDLANDFDEFVEQLRRVPGDAGALGVVILDSDVFVLVRVRGKKVEVVVSDVLAAWDWPIARDAVDFLGEDLPEDDEDGGCVGDFDMLADAGLPEFDLEQMCSDFDADPIDIVAAIAKKLGFEAVFTKVAAGL